MVLNVSYKAAVFFIGITAVLFVTLDSQKLPEASTDQPGSAHTSTYKLVAHNLAPTASQLSFDPDNQPTSLESAQPQSTRPTSPKNPDVTCNPLQPSDSRMPELVAILSPEILSQADPFSYMLDKTAKLQRFIIPTLRFQLDSLLQRNRFSYSQCYVPYANALSSLLQCWMEMYKVTSCIRRIQDQRSSNDADFASVPFDESASPEFFSSDIFTDPQPPVRLLRKLLVTSKDSIANEVIQLRSFAQKLTDSRNIPKSKWAYIWYSNAIREFLRNQRVLDDLKRNLAEIQRLSTSGQRLSP